MVAPQPCIRCGECAPACPAGVHPQRVLAALRREAPDEAQSLGLNDCTGCAACDAHCPSAIPLAALFAAARDELRLARQRSDFSAASRVRYTQREARLARAREEQAVERERQRAANASAQAVAAALARSRARRKPAPWDGA